MREADRKRLTGRLLPEGIAIEQACRQDGNEVRRRPEPGLILRTLVTTSGSDSPSQSCLLCHGLGWTSSWSGPPRLRRRGHPASPENLPSVSPGLRDLCPL